MYEIRLKIFCMISRRLVDLVRKMFSYGQNTLSFIGFAFASLVTIQVRSLYQWQRKCEKLVLKQSSKYLSSGQNIRPVCLVE